MRLIDNLQDVILISTGAVFGANIRFIIYKRIEKIDLNKDFIILIINTIASFLIGFFMSILSHGSFMNHTYQLGLFFSIGFLGSLSTFSTFIYDLYDLFRQLRFYRALILLIISLALGIAFCAIGFVLGM